MLPENLYPASYRGALFYLSTAGLGGGRKDVLKEIINSDRQSIEDLGKRGRNFTLTGVVAAQYSNTGTVTREYEDVRDSLLAALEFGGVAVLVHPFHGRIDNVACRTFELNETMDRLGMATITMTFGISDTTGAPQPEEAVLSSVVARNEAAWVALNSAVTASFDVSASYVVNNSDAVTKLTNYVAAARAATDPLSQVASEVDAYAKQLSDLATEAARLVLNPLDMVESVSAIFSTTRALLATPRAIFESMQRLFPFGDFDSIFPLTTAARIQRQNNRDLLNTLIQGGALNEAYAAAAELDFTSIEDIDAAAKILEDQYQKLAEADAWESSVEESLTEERITVTEYFNAQRAIKPRLIDVKTHTIPARVLAYAYYGSSDNGEAIAELNGVDDAAFVEGVVQILSS